MKRGRIEEANSISSKISSEIIAYNSISFKKLNVRSGAKELWDNVRDITGKNKKHSFGSFDLNLTAEKLNDYYAMQSNDLSFVASFPKSTVYSKNCAYTVNEMSVFYALDKLKCTAAGADGLPFWLLKLTACSIAKPLSHLYNLSLFNGVVPTQWKKAIITPIPKVPQPDCCADYRSISLTPIPSRVLEKLVVRTFLYPLFQDPSSSLLFSDQFAFRPSGSTEAALISILHHITFLLSTSTYVRVIALDFSKAFDTVRHSCILTKLSKLPISDQIFNWFIDYFQGHSHATKFRSEISNSVSINASVFQGSALGPSMFVINTSDLKPVNSNNFIDKYADDTYLIVSSNHEDSLSTELQAIDQWAFENNLKLNKKKSSEMIIYTSETKRASAPPVAPLPEITRVNSIKILGVIVQENLSMKAHVSAVCQTAAQSLFALRLLKSHGLDRQTTQLVCIATVISRLVYAAPAWWGFASADDKQVLQAIINRATRWGYYDTSKPNIEQICNKRDADLFLSILKNPVHVLHALLPPQTTHTHNIRPRVHNRQLPKKGSALLTKNFIYRLIYKDVY